jgi:hypothetical protein
MRPPDELEEILAAALHGCGRNVPMREMEASIRDAAKCVWTPGEKQTVQHQAAWPRFDEERYRTITSESIVDAYELWEKSPIRFMDDQTYTEDIIDVLFPHNPWLCCGMSETVFDAMGREAWRQYRGGLSKQQFIVPSACNGKFGKTRDGKESAHCLDNTGPRMYLVIEQDKGTHDEQSAIITHLAKDLQLVMVLSSGGKSLHAWFNVKGMDERTESFKKLQRFMRYAVSLGADPATWVKSQFVRMPDGLRDNGNRQSVFYFDSPNT